MEAKKHLTKAPHPPHCTGCRHSMRYATIIHGQVHREGLCLRPRAHTVWGQGCRHYAEASQKPTSSICKDKE